MPSYKSLQLLKAFKDYRIQVGFAIVHLTIKNKAHK